MPDPTPERGKAPAPCVTKLVNWIDEQLNGPGHETGHQSWLSDIADTLERQRAEIEALTALVEDLEWSVGTPRGHCNMCDAPKNAGHMDDCDLRARLAATGESDD